jgi:hypothetical protein
MRGRTRGTSSSLAWVDGARGLERRGGFPVRFAHWEKWLRFVDSSLVPFCNLR